MDDAGVCRGGYDLETEVELTLEEVLQGAEREVEFTRLDVCSTCTGSGARQGTKPTACTTCGGNGQVAQSGLGGMFRMVTACPSCQGRGTVITDPCGDCRGKGRVPIKRNLSVKIPAGVHSGQAVRVQAEGEPPGTDRSPSGQGVRGDLHVAVRVREHRRFERDGNNLHIALPVAYSQMALGAEVDVPTLDGDATAVTIPAGTQHGTVVRVAGAGVPDLRSGVRGDLLVICQLIVPRKLTEPSTNVARRICRNRTPRRRGWRPEFLGQNQGRGDRWLMPRSRHRATAMKPTDEHDVRTDHEHRR